MRKRRRRTPMNAERPSSPAFALGSSSREAFVLEVGCGRTPSEVVMVLVLITHPPKFERHISSRRPVDALGVSRVTGAHSLEEACTESIGALWRVVLFRVMIRQRAHAR